ncbi:hypothetical protein BASA81_016120 [Batrachochytrium salamandrivorans]|nr:hypothetical protein BASA81_016120 [Batrachochytrium salamandrivorans]
MTTKARWNTEAIPLRPGPVAGCWMTSKPVVEVGLLVESGLDGDVGSFAEYASGLLALALEALDDVALSVFGDRYAESSTVFCGAAVDLGYMLHLVTQDWSENGAEVCD